MGSRFTKQTSDPMPRGFSGGQPGATIMRLQDGNLVYSHDRNNTPIDPGVVGHDTSEYDDSQALPDYE